MKRLAIFLCVFVLLLSLTGCFVNSRTDSILDSLGKYDSKQHWTSGEFQDYTDFGIYVYPYIDLTETPYFAPISSDDITTICEYLDDFDKWIAIHQEQSPNDELVINYAFDRSIIDTTDCFYIYANRNGAILFDYDVWFLDMQTNTLYYFHNNI